MSSPAKPVTVKVMPQHDVENGTKVDGVPVATPVTAVRTSRLRPLESFIEGPTVNAVDGMGGTISFSERELILIDGYKVSRVVRVVAFIEIIFVLFFGILVPPFLVVLPFPMLGYYGARKWVHCCVYIFTVYTVLEIVVGVVSLFYFYKEPVYFGLRVVDIIFNVFVLRKASNLTAFIRYLEPQDRQFLLTNPAIKAIERGVLI